jgi:putative phage-type endonuclease
MQQQTTEWHELRKIKIGASDSAAILGISPWKTARDVYFEKIGAKPECEASAAMQRGLEMEPIAREWFENTWGIKVPAAVRFHRKHDWMMASLDGLNEEKQIVLEIKCPGAETHQLAKQGIIPEHYMCQIQHQLSVINYKLSYYLSYYKSEGLVIPVERNDVFINNALIPALEKFWDCLINRKEPEFQDGDYKEHTDPEWINAASEWENLAAQIRSLTEKQDAVKGRLVEMADGFNSVGGGIKLVKAKRKGNVDYAKIPELKVLDLNQYRKADTEYWMIRTG